MSKEPNYDSDQHIQILTLRLLRPTSGPTLLHFTMLTIIGNISLIGSVIRTVRKGADVNLRPSLLKILHLKTEYRCFARMRGDWLIGNGFQR